MVSEYASFSRRIHESNHRVKRDRDPAQGADIAYSLHEIEEALIGPGMTRTKHLDVFIADLTLLAPLLFTENRIEYRVIDGVPYFRWRG